MWTLPRNFFEYLWKAPCWTYFCCRAFKLQTDPQAPGLMALGGATIILVLKH